MGHGGVPAYSDADARLAESVMTAMVAQPPAPSGCCRSALGDLEVPGPDLLPSTYQVTLWVPVFADAIVTIRFWPLGASWALAHSRFFLPGNFTHTL